MALVAGKFRAKGASGGLGYTSGDQPQVAVELHILDPDYAGETITWFGYFTDKTQERTFETLRLLGWKGDDLSDLTGITDNEVSVVIEEDEYQGDVRLKVKWINKVGGLALKTPMTPEQAKAFAIQMKGNALASRGGNAAPAARTPAQGRSQPQPQRQTPQQRKTTRQEPPDDYNGGGGNGDIPF